MQSLPLVTVITPTYNHEKYIVECIKSVQAQTFSNWEMIIVNDGSTDRTAEVVANYIKDDNRITLINQENVGVFRLAETYNKALSLAQGKYISILEGDDIWVPVKLERQIKVLENNDNIVMAWGKTDKRTNDFSKSIGFNPDMNPKKIAFYTNKPVGAFLNLLLIENHITALTVTCRKDALLKIGGFQQSFGLPIVDIPTWLELAKAGEFYFDKEMLSQWRISDNQVTKTYPVEMIKGQFALSMHHFDHLQETLKNMLFISKRTIVCSFNDRIQIAFARSGRYKLLRKDYAGARSDYLKAVFYKGVRNPLWRLRAIIGYVFSLFKKDVEGISKLLGKDFYRNS